MTFREQTSWWIYVLGGLWVLFYLVPLLWSQPDTALDLLGVAILILYGVWTYHKWAKKAVLLAIKKLKENVDENR